MSSPLIDADEVNSTGTGAHTCDLCFPAAAHRISNVCTSIISYLYWNANLLSSIAFAIRDVSMKNVSRSSLPIIKSGKSSLSNFNNCDALKKSDAASSLFVVVVDNILHFSFKSDCRSVEEEIEIELLHRTHSITFVSTAISNVRKTGLDELLLLLPCCLGV